jgi:hypothetical protein
MEFPRMRRLAALLAVGLGLAACSHPAPPVGRWEGTYESNDTMIVARMEIAADGTVRVSAPDISNLGATPDDRALTRENLAGKLAAAWPSVGPREMDFDGKIFRKPGGIAPQMIWKDGTKEMWLVVYIGAAPSIRVALHKVDDFSDNPWPV